MNLGLAGKRVLITGGTRGIGHDLCLAFAAAGASVITCYRSSEEAASLLRSQLKESDGDHEVIRADVTDPADVSRLIEVARVRFGGCDVLVTCGSTISHTPVAELDLAEWHRVVDANLSSVYGVIHEALPLLRPGSSVVVVGSRSALVGVPQRAHYTAAKAALIGLTRSLAKELGPRGVRVNVLAPGVIAPTEGALPPQVEQTYRRLTALGRLGRGEEIAGPALFLASDLSSYVTGETLHVDGGI